MSEGEQLGKPYDLKLLRRFFGYARPYAALIGLTCFFILAATAADLVLPYLTKVALDRHIVVSAQEVVTGPETDPRAAALINRRQELFVSTGDEGVFFLTGENARKIDPADLSALRSYGAIRPGWFYLVENRPGPAMEVVQKRPELFRSM